MKPWKPKYVLWIMNALLAICALLIAPAIWAMVCYATLPAVPPDAPLEANLAHLLLQQYYITVASWCGVAGMACAFAGKAVGYWGVGNVYRYYGVQRED